MKFRSLGLCAAIALAGTAAQAATLTVNVAYGSAGSQGAYRCDLYKNGYLVESKRVQNTGLVSGRVEFNVDRRNSYWAHIHCTTNNTFAFTEVRWFQPYFISMNLSARFPR